MSVHERPEDIDRLQALIDSSYAHAGEHLLSIHSETRRLSALEVAERLQGMCLLVLATVNGESRPLTSPVDGVFYRGSFYFGTDQRARRWQHLMNNPAVSATHLPSEDWAVTVHGRATGVAVGGDAGEGIRSTLLEVYTPRYGPAWEQFLDSGPRYARIDADRMFAIDVTAGRSAFAQSWPRSAGTPDSGVEPGMNGGSDG